MVAEEVGCELGVDLRELLEVAGLGAQGELGDVHAQTSLASPRASRVKAERQSYAAAPTRRPVRTSSRDRGFVALVSRRRRPGFRRKRRGLLRRSPLARRELRVRPRLFG